MPRIEQYGLPQVTTKTARQPRMSGATGKIIAAGNEKLAQGVRDVVKAGQDIVQRIDTTSAEEALTAFERDKNDLFFNPETGYFNTQGKNAYDGAQATTEALASLKAQYGDTLNQNARSMFDRVADAQIERSQRDIMKHSSSGLKAWEVATVKSQVENTLETASLYWNQPDKVRVQNALGRQAVIDAAEMEGIGEVATNERLQTYDSSFAKASINAALGHSAQDGKEALARYGEMLEEPDRIKIENSVNKKFQLEKDQKDSQQAIVTAGRLVQQYESRQDVLDKVNEIEDPDLRKKTMSESMRQFNLQKQAKSEAQQEAYSNAEDHILNGGSAETYQAEDPEGWDRLSAKQKATIQKGQPTKTDWNVYSDVITMPKEQLAQVDPADYFQDLAPTERNKLISAVKSARGTGSSRDKVDHQVGRTRTSQTTSAVEQILGKKSKWNDEDFTMANAFYDLLDSEVQFRESQKEGSLTSQEFTDVLSDLTRSVTINRSAFGVDFLAPDVERDVTDIPAENMRQLSQFLRSNGIPVTSTNLLRAYRQASE